MAKKTSKREKPTFEIRMVGGGVKPELVPINLVNEALVAVQDIVAGRDSFEDSATVEKDQLINLVDVKRGSAVYSVYSKNPSPAIGNIKSLGRKLKSVEKNITDLASSISPIEKLSKIARSFGCVVRITPVGDKKDIILEVKGDDYDRISKSVFVSGQTTIVGELKKAGGATEMRCVVRLSDRRKLLYCSVVDETVLKDMGKHLYETIALTGRATWVQSNWYVHKFKVESFSKPSFGKTADVLKSLREAGMDAWDEVSNPIDTIGEMR